jgi:hypothetical protein
MRGQTPPKDQGEVTPEDEDRSGVKKDPIEEGWKVQYTPHAT